jgi:hypothetical protein
MVIFGCAPKIAVSPGVMIEKFAGVHGMVRSEFLV